MVTLLFSTSAFSDCTRQLIAMTRSLSARGWTPATSSNFSMRIDGQHAAITVSGRDKGQLDADDFMVVDMKGHPVATEQRPSAETLLHTQLYRRFNEVGCVLHTHSQTQTVASLLFADRGHVRLEGYELLKALSGNETHETVLDLPVLSNSQDMPSLAEAVDLLLDRGSCSGYLIAGHGLYAWGRDGAEAMRHLEAIEFMLSCELDLLRLRGAAQNTRSTP